MGAWGYGLFESDHDLDLVGDLNCEMNLHKLEEEARAKLKAEEDAKGIKYDENDFENSVECRIHYTIHGSHCTDKELVRNYVESSGQLDKLIEKWTTKALGKRGPMEFFDPKYSLVLLGACAMELGCTLKDEFLECLKGVFTEAGLMSDALKQMDQALNGPHGFKNGQPYEFRCMSILDAANAQDDDDDDASGLPWKGLNVPSPGPFSFFGRPDNSVLINKIKKKMELIKKEKPDGVCGGCGAAEGKGGQALLTCAKCKERKYCSKECQKAHWGTHKQLCAKPPSS